SDQRIATGSYLVAVPIGAGVPEHDDLVDVYECPDDPVAVGLTLHVVDIPTASIVLQRNLRCEVHTPAPATS
ncbi:MAG TPA: DUF6093 family protein, partial [Actinoplanes sp.]